MPEALLAVDRAGREPRGRGRARRSATRSWCGWRRNGRPCDSRVERRPSEVVAVPRPEECRGPRHQRARVHRQHAPLRLGFALAIGIGRAGRIVFRDRPGQGAPSNTRSEEKVTSGMSAAAQAPARFSAPSRIPGEAGVALGFGIGDPNEAGGVDHRPRLVPLDRRRDRRRIADVELGSRRSGRRGGRGPRTNAPSPVRACRSRR